MIFFPKMYQSGSLKLEKMQNCNKTNDILLSKILEHIS